MTSLKIPGRDLNRAPPECIYGITDTLTRSMFIELDVCPIWDSISSSKYCDVAAKIRKSEVRKDGHC
jgi:hypothetical protein